MKCQETFQTQCFTLINEKVAIKHFFQCFSESMVFIKTGFMPYYSAAKREGDQNVRFKLVQSASETRRRLVSTEKHTRLLQTRLSNQHEERSLFMWMGIVFIVKTVGNSENSSIVLNFLRLGLFNHCLSVVNLIQFLLAGKFHQGSLTK